MGSILSFFFVWLRLFEDILSLKSQQTSPNVLALNREKAFLSCELQDLVRESICYGNLQKTQRERGWCFSLNAQVREGFKGAVFLLECEFLFGLVALRFNLVLLIWLIRKNLLDMYY